MITILIIIIWLLISAVIFAFIKINELNNDLTRQKAKIAFLEFKAENERIISISSANTFENLINKVTQLNKDLIAQSNIIEEIKNNI